MPRRDEDRVGVREVVFGFSREANQQVYEATLRLIDYSEELKDTGLNTRIEIHLKAVKKILAECIGDQVDLSKLILQSN